MTPASEQLAPRWLNSTVDQRFPEFPWNQLTPLWERAARHPSGTIDLSVGAPVDATPAVVREALVSAANAPGYPMTEGPTRLRQAVVDYLRRQGSVLCVDEHMVLPTIGSKEAIAALPSFLGLGPTDIVALPDLGYPTYEIGALAVGSDVRRYVDPHAVDTAGVALMWVNSPSNPEGRILDPSELRALVRRCRASGTLLVSDECYLDFGWTRPVVSVLHPGICEGSPDGLLMISSLSKRSNLAGFRAGFLAGDPVLIDRLREYRKHMGQMVPTPVQAAMVAALEDDEHVVVQRARYLRRRAVLSSALVTAGFVVDHSEGGLYFWIRRSGENCWQIADWFADLGIICVPGEIYGVSGRDHVRLTITASGEHITQASERVAAGGS